MPQIEREERTKRIVYGVGLFVIGYLLGRRTGYWECWRQYYWQYPALPPGPEWPPILPPEPVQPPALYVVPPLPWW